MPEISEHVRVHYRSIWTNRFIYNHPPGQEIDPETSEFGVTAGLLLDIEQKAIVITIEVKLVVAQDTERISIVELHTVSLFDLDPFEQIDASGSTYDVSSRLVSVLMKLSVDSTRGILAEKVGRQSGIPVLPVLDIRTLVLDSPTIRFLVDPVGHPGLAIPVQQVGS